MSAMVTVTRKGVWAHKRRLLATCTAVVLGVAFLVGTLVVGDTARKGFDTLFVQANDGIDAMVRGDLELGSDEERQRNPIDAGVLDVVRAVDGVAAAVPSIEGTAQLVAADGERLGGDGPPTLAGNWIDDPELNPYRLVEGRAPAAPGEVVIDRRSSREGDLPVGSTTTVFTPEPVTVTVVGTATFGDVDSLGPTTYVAFTLEDAARHLMGAPGRLSGVAVRAAPGVGEDELVARLARVLPEGTEAVTGTQLTDEANAQIESDFLGFFETLLLVFAGIALLVATFSIYNTFSILVAQRSREAALLRAIGASRGQVLRSITAEALVVGVVASVLGIAAGIGLAAGLLALLDASGMAMPDADLTVRTGTVVAGAAVGVLVTLVASVAPAVRGSRVPPLAALRDVALDRSGTSRVRAVLGVLTTGAGVAVVLSAALAGGDASRVETAAVGAALCLVGMVVLGPVVARPAAAVLGAPLPLVRGLSGAMARGNAMRNPRRTAGTAAALMVGVAVVALFTTLAASLKTSIAETGARTVRGDLVIASRDFSGAGLAPSMVEQVRALPEVEAAVGIGFGTVLVDGEAEDVSVADPEGLTAVVDLDERAGSMEALAADELAVSEHKADAEGWVLGQRIPVTFGDGATAELRVAATYGARDLLGDLVLPTDAYAPHVQQRRLDVVGIRSAAGVTTEEARAAVQRVAEAAGAPDVQDRDEYIDSVGEEVDQALAIVYGLLVLAVVIALMGIANTLALSIHERTRELGLLRAVGQTRRQTRTMVRWESVILAVFGTLGGVGLGLFLGWGLVESTSSAAGIGAFTAPVGQLGVIVAIGAAAGVLAGVRPALRAARVDVLRAISAD